MISKRLLDYRLPPHDVDRGTTFRQVNGETPRAYAIRRAGEMGFDAFTFLGRRRDMVLVDARTTIVRELREKPWGLSFPAIGKAINRHHTSVMNLCGAFDWEDIKLRNGRFARACVAAADKSAPSTAASGSTVPGVHRDAAPRAGESGERSLRR